jgi:hypothetical protein
MDMAADWKPTMRADQPIAIASALTGLEPGVAGHWGSPRRRQTLSAVMAGSRAASGCSRPTWARFDSHHPDQIRSLKGSPVRATDPVQHLTLVCDQGNGSNPEKILVSLGDRRGARKLAQDFNRDGHIVVQSAQSGHGNMRPLHSDAL